MKYLLSFAMPVFAVGFIICTLVACLNKEGTASTVTNKKSLQKAEIGNILGESGILNQFVRHYILFKTIDKPVKRAGKCKNIGIHLWDI